MDPALIELLKSAPLGAIYIAAIVWLGKTLLRQQEDNHKETVALIDRYHALTTEVVKQLAIIAEEIKKD